jgi:hypothetical protein
VHTSTIIDHDEPSHGSAPTQALPSTTQKRPRPKDVHETQPPNSAQPVAGPSVRRSERVQHVPVEDSDSDEETPEEKAARLWEIKMHKVRSSLLHHSPVLTITRKLSSV